MDETSCSGRIRANPTPPRVYIRGGSRMAAIVKEIEHGPSREKLFDALRLHHEGRTEPFTLPSNAMRYLPGKVKDIKRCKVLGVEAEDGSGNSWLLKGTYSNGQRFTAYYRTDNRTGKFRMFS